MWPQWRILRGGGGGGSQPPVETLFFFFFAIQLQPNPLMSEAKIRGGGIDLTDII